MERPGTLLAKFVAGERVTIASRNMLLALFAASIVSLAYAWHEWRSAITPLVTARPPEPLPAAHGDTKFGVSLAMRKQIFSEIAAAEPNARAEGKRGFPGYELAWSAEDHRGSFERRTVGELAARYHLSQSQVYLILDEGIREKWPGPDGRALTPYTVPLHPRRKYGW